MSGVVSVLTMVTIVTASPVTFRIITHAAGPGAEAANLVVLVKFLGDDRDMAADGYNHTYPYQTAGAPATYWELMQRYFNGRGDTVAAGSFQEYFLTMSGGKHLVTSYFPQSNTDGTVVYLTMADTVDAYKGAAGEAKLIGEICDQLNTAYPAYDTDQLDKNGDGYVDNLMILASVKSTGQYTPHSGNNGGTSEFDGQKIGAYNILETFTMDLGGMLTETFDRHTAAHEYLHTFEIPDYYRSNEGSGGGNVPVGIWDPMGSPTNRPLPLAETREQLGWTQIPEKDAVTAEYTLYTADAAYADRAKEQALKFYTPLSTGEYFVVEYRKAGTRYTTDPDWKGTTTSGDIGDGIIVYRVNPAYRHEGNLQGNDYLYVFRPGETGIRDAAGEIQKAQLGLTQYGASRTETGNADMTADITAGSICYSDGRNSGMQLKVTGQTTDSVTFQITFPDYTTQDLWDSVKNADGSSPFDGMEVWDTKTASDGKKLYVLAEESSSATLFAYDGQNWINLGTAGTTGANYDMTVYQGEIYLLRAGWNRQNAFLKYNGSGFTEVSSLAAGSSNYPKLGVVNDTLYGVLESDENKNARIYKYDGTGMAQVGDAIPYQSFAAPVFLQEDGEPALIYADRDNLREVRLEQNTWKEVFRKDTASGNAAVTAGGKNYLLSTGNNTSPVLRSWEIAGQMTEITLSGIPAGAASGDLASDGENLYLTVTVRQETMTYTAPLTDPGNLTQLGSSISKTAMKGSMDLLGDKVYVAVAQTYGNAMTVQSHAALKKQPVVTPSPTASPTVSPTASPTVGPTASPTVSPTASPMASPTATASPTTAPTASPTAAPTQQPSSGNHSGDREDAAPPPTSTPTVTPTASPRPMKTTDTTIRPSPARETATPAPTPTASPTASPEPTPTYETVTIGGENFRQEMQESTQTIQESGTDTENSSNRKKSTIAGVIGTACGVIVCAGVGYLIFKRYKKEGADH